MTGPTAASVLTLPAGVGAALLAWFAFKENFDRPIAMGMGAMVAGAVLRESARSAAKSTPRVTTVRARPWLLTMRTSRRSGVVWFSGVMGCVRWPWQWRATSLRDTPCRKVL